MIVLLINCCCCYLDLVLLFYIIKSSAHIVVNLLLIIIQNRYIFVSLICRYRNSIYIPNLYTKLRVIYIKIIVRSRPTKALCFNLIFCPIQMRILWNFVKSYSNCYIPPKGWGILFTLWRLGYFYYFYQRSGYFI